MDQKVLPELVWDEVAKRCDVRSLNTLKSTSKMLKNVSDYHQTHDITYLISMVETEFELYREKERAKHRECMGSSSKFDVEFATQFPDINYWLRTDLNLYKCDNLQLKKIALSFAINNNRWEYFKTLLEIEKFDLTIQILYANNPKRSALYTMNSPKNMDQIPIAMR